MRSAAVVALLVLAPGVARATPARAWKLEQSLTLDGYQAAGQVAIDGSRILVAATNPARTHVLVLERTRRTWAITGELPLAPPDPERPPGDFVYGEAFVLRGDGAVVAFQAVPGPGVTTRGRLDAYTLAGGAFAYADTFLGTTGTAYPGTIYGGARWVTSWGHHLAAANESHLHERVGGKLVERAVTLENGSDTTAPATLLEAAVEGFDEDSLRLVLGSGTNGVGARWVYQATPAEPLRYRLVGSFPGRPHQVDSDWPTAIDGAGLAGAADGSGVSVAGVVLRSVPDLAVQRTIPAPPGRAYFGRIVRLTASHVFVADEGIPNETQSSYDEDAPSAVYVHDRATGALVASFVSTSAGPTWLAATDDRLVVGNGRTVRIYHDAVDDGAACTDDAACLSMACVDGVCCDTPCGGNDATDCQTCAARLGARADGVCTVAAAGASCGPPPSGNGCDLAQTCDGAMATCATPRLVPDGTSCGGGSCRAGACVAALASGLVPGLVDAAPPSTGTSGCTSSGSEAPTTGLFVVLLGVLGRRRRR